MKGPFLYAPFEDAILPASRMVRTQPWSRLAVRIVLLGFILVPMGLLLVPWQQTSSGLGQVVAYNPLERRQVLGAPVKGRILRWRVTEGTTVKKGQIIAEMADVDPQALKRIGQQRSAILEQLKLAQRQARAYTNKMESLKKVKKMHRQANQLKIQMVWQKYRASVQKRKAIRAGLRTERINYKRLKRLSKEEIVSRRTYEVAALKVAKLRMAFNAAKAAVLAARAQIIEARAQRMKKGAEDQSKIDSAVAEFQKAMDKAASARNKLAKINLKVARQASQVIRAPRDAVILRLLVNEGSEMLKVGDAIAELVPQTQSFAVELWIDGNDIPLLKPGRRVRLQFEGWPAVQFMGWPSIAVGTFGGVVALVDIANSQQGKFRVVVTPDVNETGWPKTPFLRQGMKAKGWVLLDQVRLGYELWHQLNGFPPTVEGPMIQKKKSGNSKSNGYKAPLKRIKK